MKYVYFVTYAFAGRMGSCESSLPHPIESIDHVREIENSLREQNRVEGFLLVTNFILLRTEP